MPQSELKLILSAAGLLMLLVLAALLTGNIPSRRPLRWAGAFWQSFQVFAVLLVPLAVWRLPTAYSAVTLLRVVAPGNSDTAFYEEQVQRFQSPELLGAVVSEMTVQELMGGAFRLIPLNKADAARLLGSLLQIESQPSAKTIAIRVFGENPILVAAFANRIAQEYRAQTAAQTPAVSVTPLTPAKPPFLPSYSSLIRNSLIGAVTSALLAAFVAVLWRIIRALRPHSLAPA